MIPALVLTAGLATRLRPLSLVRAKAALPIAGEPLARRILRTLRDGGVTDAVLNLHWLPHTLAGRIGDGADLGMRVRYSWETPVGTFVEIEGGENGILMMTEALGRTAQDFILESYRGLFIRHRNEFGLNSENMVFRDE